MKNFADTSKNLRLDSMKNLWSASNPYAWVAVVALAVYLLKNVADPIHYGRDFDTYWLYYRDMWVAVPEYPVNMLFRTPVAPLWFGAVFAMESWIIVQTYFALSYVIVALCLFSTARQWGNAIAWLSLLFIGLCHEFFWVFNSVASENPTSVLFAVWVWGVFRYRKSVRLGVWMGLGVLTVLLVLTRPNHQVLALVVALPLLYRRNPWKIRISASAVFLITFIVGILSYCSYNAVRYDAFRVAQLGPAHMPFYRIFIHEKMVRPDNGPTSEELGSIVRADVLTREVFRDYGIDEELFWKAATPRFWIHIVDALNHRFGYLDNNSLLKKVSMEAHNRYPHVFWLSYWDVIRGNFEFPVRPKLRPRSVVYTDMDALLQREYERFESEGLENPGEADLVPGVISQLTFRPSDFQEYVPTQKKKWEVPETEVPHVIKRIYYLIGQFRPSISTVFLVVLLALFRNRFRDWDFVCLTFLGGIVVLMLCGTAMANPEPQFRYPFDPFFMLWGLIGLRVLLFSSPKQIVERPA